MPDPPSPALCKALDGLRPRLLQLDCAHDEECQLANFDHLSVPFPLAALHVINACCDVKLRDDSPYLPHIRSLNIHYGCRITFPSQPRTFALRSLTITENDALDMFADLHQHTHMLDHLERVRLVGASECDFRTPTATKDFLSALQATKSLVELHLVLGWQFIDSPLMELPGYLPPNVASLKICAPVEFIADVQLWVDCINDPEWLPKLETFELRLEVLGSQVDGDGEDVTRAGSAQSEVGQDDEGDEEWEDVQPLEEGEQTAMLIRNPLPLTRPRVNIL